jgi:hypothetical protein
MAVFANPKRKGKRSPVPPLVALFSDSFGLDPASIRSARAEEILEPGAHAWSSMATIIGKSDCPMALLLLGDGEKSGGLESCAGRIGAIAGLDTQPLLRRLPAEDWRLELELCRMGELRGLAASDGSMALLLDEIFARALESHPAEGEAETPPPSTRAASLAFGQPALLALPNLLLPREWIAGQGGAAISWTGFGGASPQPGESLRWTAAWSSGASKMGFFIEIKVPRGAEPSSVARAVEPVLAAGWKAALPALQSALPGISAPLFGRTPATAGRPPLAVSGQLFVGAASLGLSLLIPPALLGLFFPSEKALDSSPISLFLAANDSLLRAPMRARLDQESGSAMPDGDLALPSLPSFLALFCERDLDRLIQGYFLPEYGALGFQSLFFARKPAAPAGVPGAAFALRPFDERRLLASLPRISRDEWVEARRAALPLIQDDVGTALAAGTEALKGLWGAYRKGRVELGHEGKRLITGEVGERIEAADRHLLSELAARDFPLSLLEGADLVRARHVIDRLSSRELAFATWGPPRRRPALEASLSRGKRAELAEEAAILARRLGSGEEAAGTVVAARNELAARVKALLEGLAADGSGPGPGRDRAANAGPGRGTDRAAAPGARPGRGGS